MIISAVNAALEALNNPNCRNGLFGSNVDPSALLNGMSTGKTGQGIITTGDLGGPVNGQLRAAETAPTLGSITFLGSGAQSVRQSLLTATITVNSNPAGQFTSGFTQTYGYSNGVLQAATIIHELGHAAVMLYGATASTIVNDGGSPGFSSANQLAVLTLCF